MRSLDVVHKITAPGLASPLEVRVFLPKRAESAEFRPGLFLFDGQNVFDDAPSFAGGWRAHEAVERLPPRRAFAPALIGIHHGGVKRISELLPWSEGSHTGEADLFLDAVVEHVVPWAQRELGLATGPIGAAVGGSSMGGLAALYAHFRHPEVFGGAIAMSPSFWIARQRIFRYVEGLPKPSISRIYLDCGAKEGRGRMLPIVARMAEHLASRGYPDGQLMWRPDRRGLHSEQHWRRRLPMALRFMFKR